MKLAKLIVEKFRAIRNSEIEVGQELAIVGQNSAGKSSLLRALNAFFNFEDERVAFEQGRHSFQKTSTATITVEFSDVKADCKLPRVVGGGNTVRARLKYRKSPTWQVFSNGSWNTAQADFHEVLASHIRYVYVPQKRGHEVSSWGGDGVLQAAVEAGLKHRTRQRDRISPKVSRLTQEIRRIAFDSLSKKLRKNTPIGGSFSFELDYSTTPNYSMLLHDLVLRVNEGEITVDLQDTGSGTQSMTAFGLYSYLAELEGSTYVLGVEEPEQNLHPHAQRELLANLRKLPLQVLFTTHSTVMVDELAHEEVVLCRREATANRGIETYTTQLKPSFWQDKHLNRQRYYQFYKQRNSDFFYANFVVLVESPIDAEMIKHILAGEGIDRSAHAVTILNVDGVNSLPYAFHLLVELGIAFCVIVDKDYFMPYLNADRKSSLDANGFPRYRKEFKTGSLLEDMIPSAAKRTSLLDLFHSNHSKAMDLLEEYQIFCFRWAMEVDLVASQYAKRCLFQQMNVPPAEQNARGLLVNRKNALKKLENILPVLSSLPKNNYPHSYARIRRSVPKLVRSLSA